MHTVLYSVDAQNIASSPAQYSEYGDGYVLVYYVSPDLFCERIGREYMVDLIVVLFKQYIVVSVVPVLFDDPSVDY